MTCHLRYTKGVRNRVVTIHAEHVFYRVAKTRRIPCLNFVGYFLQKSPIFCGSFAERDLQLEPFYTSSPHCSKNCWIHGIMGWLWLVGSIKIYVSFAKEPYNRDCILQKRAIIELSLLTVATPWFICIVLLNKTWKKCSHFKFRYMPTAFDVRSQKRNR